MKKIAFLDYSHVFAGAERVLYNMIAHIDRNKYEPILVFPYPMSHHERYDNLNCSKLYLAEIKSWWMGSDRWKHPLRGTDFLKRFEFGRRLAQLVKNNSIDIVDINLIRNDVKMWVWATKLFTPAKIVGHFRSQSQEFVPPPSAQSLFDVVACVSQFSQTRFNLKGNHTNTIVLYDSVDIDSMQCDKTQEEAKKSLGYDESTILLTSVGQLSLHKGHDTAIKAFADIAEKYPQARLLIVGGGNESMTNYYRQLSNNLGIADKVRIPGKQLSDVQSIYRAADLTLSLTKVGEGFGLVPYESTLIGTPFIAPCFGAICEFVTDNHTGLLVDTNNLKAVINKIQYALEHPTDIHQMTLRLQKIIYNRLHPGVLAQNLDNLYSSILASL